MQDQKGGDISTLYSHTKEFIAALNKRPEIQSAATTFDTRFPQYLVEVDAARCKRAGISPSDVLDDYLNENKERQNWMRTFLKFERSLAGEETDQTMRLKIWNSVVFFNYLQVAMGDPREAGVMAVNHPYVGYLTRISLYAKYHSVSKTWMLKELHYPCLTFRKSKM